MVMSTGRTATRLRSGMLIALAMALAALAARWRTPDLASLASGPKLLAGGPAVLFGIAMFAAAAAYLHGLRTAPEPLSRRHLLVAVAIQLCAAPAPPFTSTDAMMNLAYGRLAVLGHDPYRTPPGRLPEGDPYRAHLDWPDNVDAWGPIALRAGMLAARQPTQSSALAVFKLTMLFAVLLSIVVAFRYGRSLPADEGGAAFFFYACNPLLAWELSGQAHNDALVVLCGVVFVRAAYARKEVAASLALAAGFLAKYASAPTLGLYWLLLVRSRSLPARAISATLALGLCGLAGAAWLRGSSGLRGLWSAIPDPLQIVNSFASFASLAENITGAPFFRLWSACGILLCVVLAVRYARRSWHLADVMVDSLSFTLLYQLFVSARYWPWYATWLLPLALAHDNRHQRVTVAVFCSIAPALYLWGVAGGMAILLVHGLTFGLWWTARSADPASTGQAPGLRAR